MIIASQMDGHMGDVVVSTLALSVAAGAILMVLAKRMNIPGIVLLLFGGVLLGPEGLGLVQPDTLGTTLNVMVAVAVGLILFEGGLTLDVAGYRSAPKVIRNLLTVGVLVTWVGVALLIWLLFRVEPKFAVLAASLVIVTGPTVVQPILKRIRLKWNLHNILHWEGVLIDPIGVFLAVMTYEWVVGGGEEAFLYLLIRITGGLIIGFVGGEIVAFLLKKRIVPEEMINVFIVGSAMLIFGATEAIVAEGGLLAVTVAGLVIFVVRPLAVFASTRGSGIKRNELVFLSWIAPRGVVAASMASLFTLTLVEQGQFENPDFLESFVYSVIFATVLLQGPTASPIARLLKLVERHPDGWLIIGAHPVAREMAHFLERVRKVPVALIDGNRGAVQEAKSEGLKAFYGDARETARIEERSEMRGVGKLLAFTDNEDLNELLCKKWEPVFGKNYVYRWASSPTAEDDEHHTGVILWSWMPKPSMISSELLLGEAAMVELSGPRKENPGSLAAVLTAHAKEVLLDPGPESKLKSNKAEPRTLYLQREADYLLNALDARWVIRTEDTDAEGIYKVLAERLAKSDAVLSGAAIYDQVIEREKALPTTLGHGVALPHVKIPGLKKSTCAVALVPGGVQIGSEPDPVRLVFMLASPEEEPEMPLAVLGEIARLCADPEVREMLFDCESPDELLPIVRQYRRQHTPFADARG
jgi:NhaP-type Na+/H+ or K+/H+ antiporter/mannitol/fructose-specific phosphotransferase system IIA component (Ntr-type)